MTSVLRGWWSVRYEWVVGEWEWVVGCGEVGGCMKRLCVLAWETMPCEDVVRGSVYALCRERMGVVWARRSKRGQAVPRHTAVPTPRGGASAEKVGNAGVVR